MLATLAPLGSDVVEVIHSKLVGSRSV